MRACGGWGSARLCIDKESGITLFLVVVMMVVKAKIIMQSYCPHFSHGDRTKGLKVTDKSEF